MEYLLKPKQKLSLSSTFNQLHTTLWQQKEKNYFFEKQNIILNTKINSIKQNFNFKASKLKEDYAEEKQQLRDLYALIKQQEQWIKQTTVMIEEKNFDREYKRKVRAEKKLKKTNKKCKELTKKLHKIQHKIDLQQKDINTPTRFLGYYGDNQNKKEVEPSDVLAELEKQNQELSSLYRFKDHELANQNRKVKCINNEIIDLLALKNWLRKLVTQPQKLQNVQKIKDNSFYARPNTSDKTETRIKYLQKASNSSLHRFGPSSVFRQGSKLKITTY